MAMFVSNLPDGEEHGALVGEALVVGDVPVEDVQFVVGHGVERLLNGVDGEEVP